MTENFSETPSKMGRDIGIHPGTVRSYCDEGLVEFLRLANGTRLLKPSAALRIREVYAERIARRGHKGIAA
jgi:hypothetical protein